MTHTANIVAKVYQDQFGMWDARNAANQIISTGSRDEPQPKPGDLIELDDLEASWSLRNTTR